MAATFPCPALARKCAARRLTPDEAAALRRARALAHLLDDLLAADAGRKALLRTSYALKSEVDALHADLDGRPP